MFNVTIHFNNLRLIIFPLPWAIARAKTLISLNCQNPSIPEPVCKNQENLEVKVKILAF